MSVRATYLRPVGLVPDARAESAEEVTGALPLAGGLFAFTGVELIERGGVATTARILGLSDLFARDWGGDTLAASAQMDALVAARPRLAGLALDRPRLMGIVNVTPDSFSDGGRLAGAQAAIDHAFLLEDEGADILDIGGESTRPGAEPVPVDEELARVLPVIEGLAGKTRALVSIDTRKARVMREAVAAGANLVNDVSALTYDPDAMAAAAEAAVPVVLMHAQGDPRAMQSAHSYGNVLLDVFDFLRERIGACEAAGIPRTRTIVDPGIGFGKTMAHNLSLLAGLSLFHALGVPLLLGASRKSFIGRLTGVEAADQRMLGSVGAALAAAAQGAQILRVHDVRATREALAVWEAATTGRAPPRPSGD